MKNNMKSKIIYSGLSIFIVTIFIICLANFYNQENEVIMDEHISKESGTTSISMMYETEAGSGVYQESADSSFSPAGYNFNAVLSKCENGSALEYDSATGRVMMYANKSDRCYVYFDKNNTFSNYLTNLYITDGENGLYLHDTDLANGAGDNSLRYSGANPDNYVCFGTNAETCPDDNLYRIVGVFNNQVKLIKYVYANSDLLGSDGDFYFSSTITEYYWNKTTETNSWRESGLNTVNLNTNYINNIGSVWASKIAQTSWSVGVVPYSVTYTAKQYYDVEMTYETEYNAKIGLMYVSDYGFATSLENWTTTLSSYNNDTNKNNNWMFSGYDEWTISCIPGTSGANNAYSAFLIDYRGFFNTMPVYRRIVGDDNFGYHNEYGTGIVRPSFFLNSAVFLTGGSGTSNNPFRIL